MPQVSEIIKPCHHQTAYHGMTRHPPFHHLHSCQRIHKREHQHRRTRRHLQMFNIIVNSSGPAIRENSHQLACKNRTTAGDHHIVQEPLSHRPMGADHHRTGSQSLKGLSNRHPSPFLSPRHPPTSWMSLSHSPCHHLQTFGRPLFHPTLKRMLSCASLPRPYTRCASVSGSKTNRPSPA
jgi:hypothetical protein